MNIKVHIAVAALVIASNAKSHADSASPLDGVPQLKEGLWSIQGYRTNSSNPDKQAFNAKLCRDQTYDNHSHAFVTTVKECSSQIVAQKPNLYSTKITCTVGATTIVSTTTVTYQSDTSVHSDSQTTYTPALQGKTSASIVQDQLYLGPCPANMKPGDTDPPNAGIR